MDAVASDPARAESPADRQPRSASGATVLLAFLAWAGAGAATQAFPPIRAALRAVGGATGGWLNPTLTANALVLAAVLAVALGPARLRWRDLGLRRRGLASALAVGAGLWAVWQASLLLLGLARLGGVRLSTRWTAFDPSLALGMLAAMLAVALAEEVWFRGLLLTQLRLRLEPAVPGHPSIAAAMAVGLTSLFFGAVHLWGADAAGSGGALLFHTLNGVVFALLFLWTGNLWLSVAVHWLGNWGLGMPLFHSGSDAATVLLALKLGLVFIWPVVAPLRRAARPADRRQPKADRP